MKNRIFIILNLFIFLTFITAFSLISIFDEDGTFSIIENRYRASMPKFTIGNYFDSSFAEDFQTYYDDNFPYKNSFLLAVRPIHSFYNFDFFAKRFADLYDSYHVNSNNFTEDEIYDEISDSALLSNEEKLAPETVQTFENASNLKSIPKPTQDPVTEVEQPYKTEEPLVSPDFTNDKYVIYKGRTMARFIFNNDSAIKYAKAVNEIYTESGMPNTYVLSPISAYELYYPNAYKGENIGEEQAREILASALKGPTLIDTYPVYMNRKDEYICFKTDHHWTPLGAYYGYSALLNEMGEEPIPVEEYETYIRDEFLGYYYRAFYNSPFGKLMESDPDSVAHYIPKHSADVYVLHSGKSIQEPKLVEGEQFPGTYTLYDVWLPMAHIKSSVDNGKSIMVIRDSFGHMFMPFLIDHFEDIYFVEPRAIEKGTFKVSDFIREREIDNVVFLNFPITVMGSGWDQWWEILENIK